MDWKRSNPLKKATFGRLVLKAMSGNTQFNKPPITMVVFEASIVRTENAEANKGNGQVAKDELKLAKTALDDNLEQLADYVESVAKGDANIVHTAGFNTVKAANGTVAARVAASAAPAAPVLTAQKGGDIKVTSDPAQNASIYCFVLVLDGVFNVDIVGNQIVVPAGANVYVINSTKRIATFKNLPAMKSVEVAVCIVNSGGISGFSAVSKTSTIV